MVEILRFGDRALLINFDQNIDPGINQKVLQLKRQIETAKIQGFSHSIPAFCSLCIVFDPSLQNFEDWKIKIKRLLEQQDSAFEIPMPRKLKIPVCYDDPFCVDLENLSLQLRLSKEEIIHLHTNHTFQVYMLGFLPGFAYMGKLPEALRCNRHSTPRLQVSAGAVGLADYQTGIYPSEGPGGWQIIGSCPFEVFAPNTSDPFLFKAGDHIRFEAINQETYTNIQEEIKSGNFSIDDYGI